MMSFRSGGGEGNKCVFWIKINPESIEIAIEVQKRQGLRLIWKLGQCFHFQFLTGLYEEPRGGNVFPSNG